MLHFAEVLFAQFGFSYIRCHLNCIYFSHRKVAHSKDSAPSRNSDFGSLAQIVKVRKRRNLALNTESANCRTFYVRRMRNREGVGRARVGPPPSAARWFQFLPINPTLINIAVASVISVTLHCSSHACVSTSVLMRGDGPFNDDCLERFCIRSARSGLDVTFHMAERGHSACKGKICSLLTMIILP